MEEQTALTVQSNMALIRWEINKWHTNVRCACEFFPTQLSLCTEDLQGHVLYMLRAGGSPQWENQWQASATSIQTARDGRWGTEALSPPQA